MSPTAPDRIAGRRVAAARPVGGGSINAAARCTLDDGTEVLLKSREDARAGEFADEAAALRWLAEPAAIGVPRVIDVGEQHLALEWIDAGGAPDPEQLGRGLARLHRAGADGHGAPWPYGFGDLWVGNEPAGDGTWAAFYAERRLLPVARAARDRGALDAAAVADVERVCGRLAELVPEEPPARLHGDLWSGNVLADRSGRPWLIDPAAHGGHREVDLAMLRMFGSPAPRCFAAYDEVHPLAPGNEERVALFQLLPYLVHAALFGGSYGAQAARIARGYAR